VCPFCGARIEGAATTNLLVSLVLLVAAFYFGTLGAAGACGAITGAQPDWKHTVYVAIAISALIGIILLAAGRRDGRIGRG